MPLTRLHEGREPRVQAMLLGHVRLGTFNGKHPQESPTLIFTSSDRQRLEPLARDFGGKITEYKPQGMGEESWRLVSETDALTCLMPFPNLEANVDQAFELFGTGGLKRACDGFAARLRTVDAESGEVTEEQAACVCEAKGKMECATTTRLHLLLPQTGLGIWLLTTHSKIAAIHLWDQARFIAQLAKGRMNNLPIRLLWAPRTIHYFDQKEKKRRSTTKRVVSLSIAGDAERALAPLGLEPDRGLIQAVSLALEDAGRRALSAGEGPTEQPAGSPEGAAPRGRTGTGSGESSGERTHSPSRSAKERYDVVLTEALDASIAVGTIKTELSRLYRSKKWRWSWPLNENTTDEQFDVMTTRLTELVAETTQGRLGVGS
jgi:hypothetical protein